MRKILFITFLFLSVFAEAQQYNTVSFSPATFTGEDSVTITVDFTGTPLAGASAVYLWTWCNKDGTIKVDNTKYPGKDGIYNDNFGNQTDKAKMINIGGNKWQFGMIPSNMYLLPAGQLKVLQMLFKTKDGSTKAYPDDSPQYPIAPIEFVPSTYRLFPDFADQNDAITIYFYQNLGNTIDEIRMTPVSVNVSLYDASNNQVGATKVLPLKAIADKLFSATPFVPSTLWTIPAGAVMKNFTYSINGTSYDINGNIINVTGPVNTKTFDALK